MATHDIPIVGFAWRGWVRFDDSPKWLDTPCLPSRWLAERTLQQTYGDLHAAEYVILPADEIPDPENSLGGH